MSRRKRTIHSSRHSLFIILMVVAFLTSSCTGPAAHSRPAKQIALIAPVDAGVLADAVREGADAAAKEFGVALTYVALEPGADAAAQLQAAVQMLEEGAAAIMIDPANIEVISKLSEHAAASKVPIITLNDEFIVKGIAGSIAADSEEAGNQAGEAMAELLGGIGTVALLGSDRKISGGSKRERGVRRALSQYEGIRVVDRTECGNVRSACRQMAMKLLDDELVDGMIALEEHSALAVADEASHRGIEGKLKIVSFGNQWELLEKLQDGIIQKTVVQNGFSIGYLGVVHADALLRGERVNHTIRLETQLIGSDNMFWMNNQKLLFPFVK